MIEKGIRKERAAKILFGTRVFAWHVEVGNHIASNFLRLHLQKEIRLRKQLEN